MKFGIATVDISPRKPATMYGYVSRTAPFAGIHDPLAFTAVLIEEHGTRVLLGAGDLGAFPNGEKSNALRGRLGAIAGCPAAHVLLNASHSHGAVYLPASAPLGFPFADESAAADYWDLVEAQITAAVSAATESLHEGTIEHGVGTSAVPMSRRKVVGGAVEMLPNPTGETDNSLHVLVFKDARGNVEAVGLRLSCHPVATRMQPLITADYVGAWRRAMRSSLGPIQAFFLQGAAGDARPRHTATVDLSDFRALPLDEMESIGGELALECERAMRGPLRRVGGAPLRGSIAAAAARCLPLFSTPERLLPLREDSDPVRQTFARACLKLLATGARVPSDVGYHVQTLWLDSQLAIVGLDLEPLSGLGRRIVDAFAPRDVMVLGYTNGLVGYAPDSVELWRGGYETTSYLYAPWSGPFAEGVEVSLLPHLDLRED